MEVEELNTNRQRGKSCPHCGDEGEQIDGALGKTAFKCPSCDAVWARNHDGYLLWCFA